MNYGRFVKNIYISLRMFHETVPYTQSCICYSLYMELWHIKENENGSKIKNRMWTFLEWI